MLEQKPLSQALKKKSGFAPMTSKELETCKLVKQPFHPIQKREFRNFVNDQMQKMMVLPGACSTLAFQEKKTEMKRIIKDIDKDLVKWLALCQKKIQKTLLSTDPMTSENIAKTYLQLAKECQANRLLKDVLIETLDPSQHATRKFHLQHLLNMHHINNPLFLASLEENMHKLSVMLWSEYILLKILLHEQRYMDAVQMRKIFTKSPETIFASINPMPFSMWDWTDLVSRYTDQHVIRLRVSEDMQLLRTEIKDRVIYTLLENYKNALMLIPSCINIKTNWPSFRADD